MVARTLSPAEIPEILERVREYKRRSDVAALRRLGIQAAPSVVFRHIFEQVREMDIERDGSVTVLTRSSRERPPTETKPGPTLFRLRPELPNGEGSKRLAGDRFRQL